MPSRLGRPADQTASPPVADTAGGIALYVHVPFCETRCPYCDFNTYAGIEHLIPPYVDALCREMKQWGALLDHPRVATVFLGGGTPSYLPPEHVGRVLQAARDAFPVDADAEITAEANPDDLTPARAKALHRAGINRLSIGVQALDDGLLRLLGRRHNALQARQAVATAQRAGFGNINLDLMFGLPDQSMEQWQASLEGALEMAPEHLSLYCLTLEPETPFAQWVATGRLPSPDPDLAADMYQWAEDCLGAAGYRHYEVSNWAQPGRESRHNLTYWRNGPYLGVGPGAHSYLNGHRFANLRSPRLYIRRVRAWQNVDGKALSMDNLGRTGAVESVERIDTRTEMGETLMLGLRLDEGVPDASFRQRFGTGLAQAYGETVQELEGLGLLEWDCGALRLTRRGRLLGNEVFQRFLSRTGSGIAAPSPP